MALSLDLALDCKALFMRFISFTLAVMPACKLLIRSMLDDGPQSETLYDQFKRACMSVMKKIGMLTPQCIP